MTVFRAKTMRWRRNSSLGVLRWQIQLDFLDRALRAARARQARSGSRLALRLGLYQLKFLTRIPPHAAINESVNLVKQRGKKSAAALVNAALRAAQREEGFDSRPGDQNLSGKPA